MCIRDSRLIFALQLRLRHHLKQPLRRSRQLLQMRQDRLQLRLLEFAADVVGPDFFRLAPLLFELLERLRHAGEPRVEVHDLHVPSPVGTAFDGPASAVPPPAPLCCTYLSLSLIHISEPTRQAEISYAVF